MSDIEEYKGADITVTNDGKRCIHSRYCVLGLPQVFVPNVDGPWIKPDAATRESVIATVAKCPSGALSAQSADGTLKEHPPGVNTVRVWQDGPLAFHAELDIAGDTSSFRATLCRCGKSNHKPFCDNMHRKSGFTATGEPESQDSQPLAVRNGTLKVTPCHNGPLKVEGSLEVCAASGRTITRDVELFFCRCGHSQDKPFCDGSHKMAGFVADGS
jgi:CDGSH-type Zn-finger protein/uncharacterized Fe-S cluster protein YjdI